MSNGTSEWVEQQRIEFVWGMVKMNHEIDLEALDKYLMSDDSPEGSMMLSDFDGFLHGIACSPVLIPAEEWMSKALGAHPATLPNWVNETVARLYMTIGQGLMASPAEVEPIFWQANEGHVIAMVSDVSAHGSDLRI